MTCHPWWNRLRLLTLALLACLAGGAGAFAGEPADGGPSSAVWPQWRGPTRDGQVAGAPWPDSLQGERLTRLWRVELGPGYSGPIVSPELVFVTETRDQKDEVVRALDRATGEERWRASWPGAMTVPFFARANGDWIRSTPAWDGEALYVAGMRDVLVCLDAASGAVRWRMDFPQSLKSPLPAFGFVCSPLVAGDAVYAQAGAAFVKLDRRSGSLLWKSLADDGGMNGSAFSSPILADVGGRPQLVVQTRTRLAGVDPADGRVQWSQEVPAFRGMNILTPTLWEGGFLTSAYGGKSFLYRPPAGSAGSLTTAWTNKAQGYMSSPVVIGGHAYLHLRNQRLTCLDLATGADRWTTEPFGKYWSLVANGDRVLALDERGILYLFRAQPERYEPLDSRKIAEAETWAHLAACGDELYIRELNAIAAYRWRDAR